MVVDEGGIAVTGGPGGGATQFSELSDVAAAALANRQAWLYNGSDWVNRLLVAADLPDLSGVYEAAGSAASAVSAHTGDATDAHAASAITNTPAGNLASTTVQAALNELDTEKSATGHNHTGVYDPAGSAAAVASAAVLDGDAAGGVLSGTYPSPGFAADMATQAELDTHKSSGDHDGRYYTETEVDTALALKVAKALFDANTILKADSDDTPAALTVAEERLIGRITGGVITGLTAAQVKTFLALVAGDLPSHGAAQHDDIARSFYVMARPFSNNDSSTGGNVGTTPDIIATQNLADAASQGFYTNFQMPADAKAASPITAIIYWASSATQSGSVVWSLNFKALVAGSDIQAAGTTTQFTGVAGAKTVNLVNAEASTQVLASVSADDLIRLSVKRLGADGADTLAGGAVARVIGIRIGYTAIQ